MKIIIADSGSTKTTWTLSDPAGREIMLTSGINPFYQGEEEIFGMLKREFPEKPKGVEALYFYGAGCANEQVNAIVRKALHRYFGVEAIEVQSDLMAAARALCGHEPGIACILGTGSNSCYYDGQQIAAQVSPLGFILGDEGSGGVLGRTFLSDLLKNQLPAPLVKAFYEVYPITPAEILNHIYKQPFPNRYAARFTRFMYDHRQEPAIRNLIMAQFSLFIERNLLQYPAVRELPVQFCGSIAFYFSDFLTEALISHALTPGKMVQDPMEGLVSFHAHQGEILR